MLKSVGTVLHYDELKYGESFGEYWLKRLKQNNVDIAGVHPLGGDKATNGLDETLELIKKPEYKSFYNNLKSNGIDVEYELHALAWMLPRDMFKKYPDWFRMDAKGNRNPDYNFCASNKDAIAWIEDRAELLAKQLVPTTNSHYIWSDDTNGNCFCMCDECKKHTPSDQYMLFTNAVLRGIRRVDPMAKHCYLAYFEMMEPPKKVEPEDGIFLEYAPILRDQFIPIDHYECEQNRNEIKHLNDLMSCFGSENSQVLEYWIDNARFSSWKKPVRKLQFDAEIMKRDVEFYLGHGFEVIKSFTTELSGEYYDMYGEPPLAEYMDVLNKYR